MTRAFVLLFCLLYVVSACGKIDEEELMTDLAALWDVIKQAMNEEMQLHSYE